MVGINDLPSSGYNTNVSESKPSDDHDGGLLRAKRRIEDAQV